MSCCHDTIEEKLKVKWLEWCELTDFLKVFNYHFHHITSVHDTRYAHTLVLCHWFSISLCDCPHCAQRGTTSWEWNQLLATSFLCIFWTCSFMEMVVSCRLNSHCTSVSLPPHKGLLSYYFLRVKGTSMVTLLVSNPFISLSTSSLLFLFSPFMKSELLPRGQRHDDQQQQVT